MLVLPSALALTIARAADPSQANDQCLACHSEQGLHNPPRHDMNFEHLALLLVDRAAFVASVHGDMTCTRCHGAEAKTFPHAADLRTQVRTCLDCHAEFEHKALPEFEASVHKVKFANFACADCHNAHTMRTAAQMTPQQTAELANGWCLDCHTNPLQFLRFTTAPTADLLKVHDWLPHAQLHWQSVRCVDCHSPPPAGDEVVSHDLLPKDKAVRACVTCHSANSALATRLYRQQAEEEHANVSRTGFINAFLLNHAYVVGVTRNVWLDWASGVILALVLLGVVVHSLIRLGAWARRLGPGGDDGRR